MVCNNICEYFSCTTKYSYCTFCSLSWKYIEEKRLKPFLGIILLASTFHITALVTIPIYFFMA
ncbi:EpsG family protein [Phocaeicola coprophilus]|uniref:EpsG family protein n=1 Tax=Phocaeicola coprophilus TaxID=387090 RepID=UPI003521D1AD